MRTVPAAGRARPALAVRGRLPRSPSTGSARPEPGRRAENRRGSYLAALNDAAVDALRRQMSGGTIAGVDLRSTRITETGLAARNRRADFPAPQASLTAQHVARSRRPRPSSTGTTREGSALEVWGLRASPTSGIEPERSAGWRGRGAPLGAQATPVTSACRAPSGAISPQTVRAGDSATGPGRGVETSQNVGSGRTHIGSSALGP